MVYLAYLPGMRHRCHVSNMQQFIISSTTPSQAGFNLITLHTSVTTQLPIAILVVESSRFSFSPFPFELFPNSNAGLASETQ